MSPAARFKAALIVVFIGAAIAVRAGVAAPTSDLRLTIGLLVFVSFNVLVPLPGALMVRTIAVAAPRLPRCCGRPRGP
jgi:hypothetical protein